MKPRPPPKGWPDREVTNPPPHIPVPVGLRPHPSRLTPKSALQVLPSLWRAFFGLIPFKVTEDTAAQTDRAGERH